MNRPDILRIRPHVMRYFYTPPMAVAYLAGWQSAANQVGVTGEPLPLGLLQLDQMARAYPVAAHVAMVELYRLDIKRNGDRVDATLGHPDHFPVWTEPSIETCNEVLNIVAGISDALAVPDPAVDLYLRVSVNDRFRVTISTLVMDAAKGVQARQTRLPWARD